MVQVGATYWSGQEPKFDGNVKVFKVRRQADRRQQAGEAARGGHAGAFEHSAASRQAQTGRAASLVGWLAGTCVLCM